MLDQADFAGIDGYIKRHGLNDASLAAGRRAKRYGVNDPKVKDEANGGGENGATAVAEDEDMEDGETELQKAERLLQDEEDEEEEVSIPFLVRYFIQGCITNLYRTMSMRVQTMDLHLVARKKRKRKVSVVRRVMVKSLRKKRSLQRKKAVTRTKGKCWYMPLHIYLEWHDRGISQDGSKHFASRRRCHVYTSVFEIQDLSYHVIAAFSRGTNR
jgi:hypothetical protein